MKVSVYLDNEASQLLEALVKEFQIPTSQIIQQAVKVFAEKQGFVIIPARVERRK